MVFHIFRFPSILDQESKHVEGGRGSKYHYSDELLFTSLN